MGSYCHKISNVTFENNVYDEIIEVTAPTKYCFNNGKLSYIAIGLPLACLTKHERKLLVKILDSYNVNTPIPSVIEKAFEKDNK